MPSYFELSTNCSKRNKKAIENMPFGEVVDQCYFRHYKNKEYWNDTRVCLIKCKNFQEVFELVKWLRSECSWLSVKRATRVTIGLKPKPPFARPICFLNLDMEEVKKTMTRTYQFGQMPEEVFLLKEERGGVTKQLLDDRIDLRSVLDGDLDLLIFSREIS